MDVEPRALVTSSPPLVLVTGGAGGLGREIALQCLSQGSAVHVCDIDPLALQSLSAQYGPEQLKCTRVDLGEEASLEELFEALRQWRRPVTALVNNVGIAGARGLVESLNTADWQSSLDANLLGAIRCTQQVLPGMKGAGCGSIVSISTTSVRTHPLGRSPYIVSKAALEAFTLSLAREGGRFGIRSNVVRPGMMDNERMRRVLAQVAVAEGCTIEQVRARELAHVTMRTMVAMRDVASMVLYLLSDAARHITGQVLTVDAGHEWEG